MHGHVSLVLCSLVRELRMLPTFACPHHKWSAVLKAFLSPIGPSHPKRPSPISSPQSPSLHASPSAPTALSSAPTAAPGRKRAWPRCRCERSLVQLRCGLHSASTRIKHGASEQTLHKHLNQEAFGVQKRDDHMQERCVVFLLLSLVCSRVLGAGNLFTHLTDS